jgi:hypothetical protein
MKRNPWVPAALLAATLLAACGGGSDNSPPPQARDPLEVPAAANASAAAMVNFLGGLPTESVNDREAVSVDSFAPPTSETDEPVPVGG